MALRVTRHVLVFGPLVFTYFPCALLGPVTHEWWWWASLRCIEHSGPAFVKFCQWAATRSDMFPAETCRRLGTLHAQTTAHTAEHTRRLLQPLLKLNPGVRLSVEEVPVGSGCIAQVHRGTLQRGGEEVQVAAKVLHPAVAAMVDADLALMRAGAWALELVPHVRWLSLRESVEEFASLMTLQMDLRIEAANLDRFRVNFRESTDINFPQPIRPLVSREVLVETLMPGAALGEWVATAKGSAEGREHMRRVARIGVDAFLKMCFQDNLVHGDLHPGNMLVSFPGGDRQGPVLTLLDAGITTELAPRDQNNFIALFTAIVKGDGEGAGALMVDNAREERCVDRQGFKKTIGGLVDEALGAKLRLANVQAGLLLARAFAAALQYQVKIESNFASICIAIMVLEGVGRELDPSLDILNLAAAVLVKDAARHAARRWLARPDSA